MSVNGDILIIGGGVIGLSIARDLSKDYSVTVIDKSTVGTEASYASGGMLAPQGELSEGEFQKICVHSNEMYQQYVENIESETGICCYRRDAATMAIAMTEEDEKEYRHTYEMQKADGLTVEWLSGAEVRKYEERLNDKARGGLYLPNDKHLENRALVTALINSCERRGVKIINGAAAIKILTTGDKIAGVKTIVGDIYADIVINAAGAWSSTISVENENLRPPVFPVRGQMLALKLPDAGFLKRTVRSPRSYLIPRHNNRIFVGATMENVGFEKKHTVWGLQKLLNGASELFPDLENATIEEFWTGLRPGTPDNFPIMGKTECENYILATGFFRNGLLLTPAAAKNIAELVRTGNTPKEIAPFNVSRFSGQEVEAGNTPGA